MNNKKPNNLIHFKRWSRKAYAVFNSLGRQYKICVMMFTCSILVLKAPLYATTSEFEQRMSEECDMGVPDTVHIESVQISAPPKPHFSSLSRVVVSFDRKEISKLPAQDIQQLLQYVASIDLRQRGGQGVQADINMRGGNYDQVMIMLNGVNFTDPQTGHYNLNIPIDLSSVERIEILQGPGSRVLGPNAFSGAINIVTKSSDTGLKAKAIYGEHDYKELGAGANIKLGTVSVHTSVSGKSSDGYTLNTDFDILNAYLHVQAGTTDKVEIAIQSGFQHKAYGANEFYSLIYPDQYEKLRTFINALTLKKNFRRLILNSNIYHRTGFDRFELFRDGKAGHPEWYKGHNYHRSDILGGSLRSEYSYLPWKTVIGVDIRGEHILSNVLGEDMSTTKPVPFEPDGTLFTKQKWRTLANWFAEQTLYLDKFSASAGVMGSYSNDFGHKTCFGIDASYQLLPHIAVYISANQSLRLPTFTDLYYKGATNIGNKELKPEHATTLDIGGKVMAKEVRANASLFYRAGRDIIDWVREEDETIFMSRNHIALNTFGTELDATYIPGSKFLNSIRMSYSFLSMDKNNRGMESSKVMDYLAHKVTISASIDITKDLTASLGWIYQLRAGKYKDMTDQTIKSFAPVGLVDARIIWRTKYCDIFAEVSNLFDRRYFDFTSLVQAGRWGKIGIIVKLGR